MADVNINTGNTLRLKEGEIRIVGVADEYIILQRVYGTCRINEGGTALIPIMNGAALDPANIRQGDDRPTTIEIQARVTKEGITGASSLRNLTKQVFTAGKAVPFEMSVKVPDSRGASTGLLVEFAECVLDPGGLTIEESDGDDTDKITLRITDYEAAPAYSTYS